MARKKSVSTPVAVDTRHAALYLRVSTDEQSDDGYGLDTQLDLTSRLAYTFTKNVAGVYVDGGVSGLLNPDERDGMSQLLADIDNGVINTVIVSALDRLARKATLLLNIWDLLEAKGVVVMTFKERIDTSTPVGRLMRTMLAAVAEFERDLIVERTTAGRNQRGKVDGDKGGAIPYGYKRSADGVMVDTDKAETVKHIFDLRKQGLTLRAIADKVNGISFRGVKIILDNEPAYRGGYRGESSVKWPSILA